jgi:hypothetical protein
MIRIAITEAAFEVIAATLRFGSAMYEPKASLTAGGLSGWNGGPSISCMRYASGARS